MRKVLSIHKKVISMFGVVMFSILCIEVKSYAQLPKVKTPDKLHEKVQDRHDEKSPKIETLDENLEEMLDQDDDKKLPDVAILGGRYGDIACQDYDHKKFRVHYLISKEAWKLLGNEIATTYGVNTFNSFITDDNHQNWAPAILMTHEDYVQTRSYYGPYKSQKAKTKTIANIAYETEQLLDYGNVIGLLFEECADIKSKFDHDYDKSIMQMCRSNGGQFRHEGNVLYIDLGPGEYVRYVFKKGRICGKGAA